VNAELGELGSLELEAATGTTGLNRSGEMFVTLDYQAMYANGPSAVKVTLRRASSDSPWFVRGHMVSYESMAIELAEETGRFLEGYFASVAGRDFDTALSLYSESFLREHPADKWRASLAATRDTLGRPGDRTLIELDVWGSVLTGATIIDLGYSVEYENREIHSVSDITRSAGRNPPPRDLYRSRGGGSGQQVVARVLEMWL
jgi:hypothetical protein